MQDKGTKKTPFSTENAQNPIELFLGDWLGEPLMRRLFIENPRIAIETKIPFPEDIVLKCYEKDGVIYFKSSIPKNPDNKINDAGQKRIDDQRLKKCPIMNVSEKEILEKMINNPGKTFSREEIGLLIDLDKERSIDVIITRLRKKIELDPKNPKFLQTIRGAGYVLWIE